ncbi:hypothetical protein HOY82DRAFT_536328 [Tuber indicum]|nr:hypothetical protein HOY82DRAFT_536328 [Tuber indicum]
MPAVSCYPNQTLLSQVKNQMDDNNGVGTVAIIGLIIAALTLIVAMMSLRGHICASYLLPSQFAKVLEPCPGSSGTTPPDDAPAAIHTRWTFVLSGLQVLTAWPIFNCNLRSNTHPLCIHTNTPPPPGPKPSPEKMVEHHKQRDHRAKAPTRAVSH